MSYAFGTELRLFATFTDVNGNLVDPTAVTLYMKDPTETVTTITAIVRQSVGVYYFDYAFTTHSGMYYYRYVGSGAVVAANEGSIAIKPSNVVAS